MEIVIPPRDHGVSTYRYTWDENGEVMQVTRVDEPQQPQPPPRRRGRQTVQWPFQSVATEETSLSYQIADQPFLGRQLSNPRARPATWEPNRLLLGSRSSASDTLDLARDLVPDYVVNYIRGETPETIAQRKRNGGRVGERGVDVVTPRGHRPHRSRTAEFEGFLDDASSNHDGHSHRSGDGGEEEHILAGCVEKRPPGGRRGWRQFVDGWRGGVALNVLLDFLILVVGIVCLVSAAGTVSLSAGGSVIFSGSCATAESIDSGVHALVSVLAVVLLAGGNYVFQVLSSPTRCEVDVAHAKRRWLDIGIPSVRNLAHIASSRAVLAGGLLLVAIVTQVMYNAIIFTSQTAVDYKLVFVTQSFLQGAPFSNATSNNESGLSRLDILSLQDLASRNSLTNLTTPECLTQFSAAYQSDFKSVLLVTNINSPTNSLVQTASASISPLKHSSVSNSGNTPPLAVDQTTVMFCLAQPSDTEQTCDVSLHGPLLGTVVALNLITLIALITILFRRSFEPLVSLGDALSSFLQQPDPTTSRSCLMTKQDVRHGRWGLREAKFWVPRSHRWFQTPSLPRWSLAAIIWLALAALAAVGLALAISSADPNQPLSRLGAIASPHAVYLPLPSSTPSSGAALLASLPQLLLAALYLSANSLLTLYHLSHESALFALADTPRPLRVTSNREGSQTTSLFLTLPRPWSWFLAALFAALSFALSQSLFAVSIRLLPPAATTTATTALSLNSTALLLSLALLALLAATVLGLGLRRTPAAILADGRAAGNPLALPGGPCSAVVAARCHAARAEREAALWRRPLAWGVVVGGGGAVDVEHCAFTAGRAGDVDLGRSYA